LRLVGFIDEDEPDEIFRRNRRGGGGSQMTGARSVAIGAVFAMAITSEFRLDISLNKSEQPMIK
jgi:hypothetical protein